MLRVPFPARHDYQTRNAEIGFDYGQSINFKYWNETAAYHLDSKEVDLLEQATGELFDMTMKLAEDLVEDRTYMSQIGLNPLQQEWIKKSWDQYNYSLYGRFDFFFDGKEIKLYEYNADTPTSLLESSLIQYYWMKDRELPDQFNSIHEKLIESWKFIREMELKDTRTYFCSLRGNLEDYRTAEYLMDTARQAGVDVSFLFIDDIGSDGKQFYDLENNPFRAAFKLYPWEWLMMEKFSSELQTSDTLWIEPPWKILLSNKLMLARLWEKFPKHELLLRTSLNRTTGEVVQKPIYGREGQSIWMPGATERTEGDYTDSGWIYQEYKPLPCFDGYYPVVGSWIIGDQPAGIGIREDKSLVTGNLSQFVSHWFD